MIQGACRPKAALSVATGIPKDWLPPPPRGPLWIEQSGHSGDLRSQWLSYSLTASGKADTAMKSIIPV